jgi:hypothetical protein
MKSMNRWYPGMCSRLAQKVEPLRPGRRTKRHRYRNPRTALPHIFHAPLTGKDTMPIEIKELHIRVNVNSEKYGPDEKNRRPEAQQSPANMMVEECVEKVLDVLERKQQR